MQEIEKKRIIEAALFVSARELTLEEIGKILETKNLKKVELIVEQLMHDYNEKETALEISKNNEKYLMKIKNEYAGHVKGFAQDTEISKGGLKVLSYVYMNKGNVLKSQVAKKLGAWIYPYVKELEEKNFISAKKAGRTKRLVLTDKFRKYFATEET